MRTLAKPWHQGFLSWADGKPEVANLAEVGLGKTWMALAWLAARQCRRILWLTIPPYVDSTIAEVRRHSQYRATAHLDSLICLKPGTVQVLAYSRITAERSTLALLRDKFDAVVADESQCLKRIQAARTRAAIRTLEGIPSRMIMTGSAITNSLMDVFTQFLFLDGGKTFGRSWVGYRQTYFYPAGFSWLPKAHAVAAIREKMRPKSFWAKTDECVQLPPIVRREIPVKPSPKALATYTALAEDFLAEVDGKTLSATFVVAKLMKMAQVLSGRLAFDDGTFGRLPCTKLETFKALARHLFTQLRKLVVWCRFIFEVEDVEAALQAFGIRTYRIAGLGDPAAKVAEFQADANPAAIVATLPKAARAFSFTAAHTAIYYNRTASVEQRVQSAGRIRRLGSEAHAQITYYDLFTAGTLEESDLRALAEKMELGASVTDTQVLRRYLAGKWQVEFLGQSSKV